MSDEPLLVSVVLAVHNDEQGIQVTLESLADQDCQSFEVIVVDDGSTDGTARVLAERGRRLRMPLRVLTNTENQGLTRSLASGCEIARGGLIARIDAGDRARSSRLSKQAEFFAAHPTCVLLGSALQYIDPCGERLWVDTYPGDPESPSRLFEPGSGGPHHASVMFRARLYSLVGGYRTDFYYAQDHDLWYRLLEHGELFYLREPLTQIRVDASGISAGRGEEQASLSRLARECALRRARGEPEDDLLAEARRVERSRTGRSDRQRAFGLQYYIGSVLLDRGDRRAFRYLWEAVRLRPWSIRAWMKVAISLSPVGRSGGSS